MRLYTAKYRDLREMRIGIGNLGQVKNSLQMAFPFVGIFCLNV